MTLSERLKLAMQAAGVSQADLARACGVKPPSVHGWLSGKSKFLRGENLLQAALVLKVRPDWLATEEGEMEPQGVAGRMQADPPGPELAKSDAYQRLRQVASLMRTAQIPLLNKETAGMFKDYMDGTVTPPTTYQYHDDETEGLFAFVVPDDLMEPKIPRGCTAIVNTNTQPQHGKQVLVLDGDTAYIRRLVIDGDLHYQETTSGRLPARLLTGTIIGVVKEIVINLDDWV